MTLFKPLDPDPDPEDHGNWIRYTGLSIPMSCILQTSLVEVILIFYSSLLPKNFSWRKRMKGRGRVGK